MANVCADDKIVTEFLLRTCRSHQWLNFDLLDALSHSHYVDFAAMYFGGGEHIPVTTGSVAEFYIQPILSCVGDVDIMFHYSDQLAIPAGTAPPIQLPDEFHSRVDVCEIVDSEFPGYVYLVLSYLLTECIDDGKYVAVQCQHLYGAYDHGNLDRHGPAYVTTRSTERTLQPFVGRLGGSRFSLDRVYCVRCLSWRRGHYKPFIGQHDVEATAGQTQQLLIMLSATDVMWFVWHIVDVDKMNG